MHGFFLEQVELYLEKGKFLPSNLDKNRVESPLKWFSKQKWMGIRVFFIKFCELELKEFVCVNTSGTQSIISRIAASFSSSTIKQQYTGF